MGVVMADQCWKNVGVMGDRSCGELQRVAHCRNCQLYEIAAKNFLNRPMADGYQEEMAVLLGLPREVAQTKAMQAVAIFRLQQEWFALAADLFQAVTTIVPVRRIPQRSDAVLLGIANVQGELQLCFSLAALLGLNALDLGGEHDARGELVYPRFAVVQLTSGSWVFPVDEIVGIERFPIAAMQSAPANVTQGEQHFTKAVLTWQQRSVSYLSTDRLNDQLQGRILT
jgi:chemotaxis-related protein WspD